MEKIQLSRENVPLFKILPRLKIDIQKLQDFIKNNKLDCYDDYTDLDFGGEYTHLCNQYNETHRKFITKNEDDLPRCHYNGKMYRQLAITSFDKKAFPNVRLLDPIPQLRETIRAASKKTSPNYLPQLDERNYSVPNQHARNILRDILDSFEARYTRSRLAVLMPGFEGKPHIDYNTSYSIRVHIPIFTNSEVYFCYIGKNGDLTKQYMPADGRAWAVNTGYTHYVINKGATPRLHLVINLESQEDIWTASEIRSLRARNLIS